MDAGKTRTGPPARRIPAGMVIGLYQIKTRRLYSFDDYGSKATEAGLTIGRSAGCDIHLHGARISAVHCRVKRSGDGVRIKDAGSKNGLWVNDVRVKGETALAPGMWIALGDTELIAMGGDGVLPIVARRNTSFLANSARIYGSLRRAAKFIGRSRSSIWRAVRRMAKRGGS